MGCKAKMNSIAVDVHRPHDFRFSIWHFDPAPLSTAIEGHGLGDRKFEPSISRNLLLV